MAAYAQFGYSYPSASQVSTQYKLKYNRISKGYAAHILALYFMFLFIALNN